MQSMEGFYWGLPNASVSASRVLGLRAEYNYSTLGARLRFACGADQESWG